MGGYNDNYQKFPKYDIIPTIGVIVSNGFEMKDRIESIRDRGRTKNGLTYWSIGIRIKNGEEKLYERLQKAVDHLATFCPKKKETF